MLGVIAVDDVDPWKVGAHVSSASGVLEDTVLNNGCVALLDLEC